MSECERCEGAEGEFLVGPMLLCEVCAEVVEEHLEAEEGER